MSAPPQTAWLPDGRLHLHHGPIDLIIRAEGPETRAAYGAAIQRFQTILTELTEELPTLRQRAGPPLLGRAARRMSRAVRPFSDYVTPMAAVAGAVADETLAAMKQAARLTKAHVNNGGDIAFYLGPGAALKAMGAAGEITVTHADAPRGLATSGWRGRSWSLGIADAVTVAARDAAAADVAATLIANAVNLPGHSAITRRPAREMAPDSDLGDRPVTMEVGPLTPEETEEALDAGLARAEDYRRRRLIDSAVLSLNGQLRVTAEEGLLIHA